MPSRNCGKSLCPKRWRRLAESDGFFHIGPIPQGHAINLLANVDPDFGQLAALRGT